MLLSLNLKDMFYLMFLEADFRLAYDTTVLQSPVKVRIVPIVKSIDLEKFHCQNRNGLLI